MVAPRGECEFVFEVASKLPIYSFCEVMGGPGGPRERVAATGNEIADTEKPRAFAEGETPPIFQRFESAGELVVIKKGKPGRFDSERSGPCSGRRADAR